jgi:hypothetical protein
MGTVQLGKRGLFLWLQTAGCGDTWGKLELSNADVKIIIGAMTFFAQLVVLLVHDSCLDTSLICPTWLPFPIPSP